MLSGYQDSMIHYHKPFELHQHEMHSICINMNSLHPQHPEYVGRMSIIYEDLWGPLWTLSTQTMSHGHNKHWDITLIPAIRERPGQTSDDLQIQSSGPVQGLARANISQDTRGCCAAAMTQAMRNWGRVKMLGDRMTRTQCDPLYGVPGHTRSCVSYQHSTVTWCCDTGCQYIITPQSEVWVGGNDKTFLPLLMEILSSYWIILIQQSDWVCHWLISTDCSRWSLLNHAPKTWHRSSMGVGTFPLLICFSFAVSHSGFSLVHSYSFTGPLTVTSSAVFNPFILFSTSWIPSIHGWSNCDWWAWVQRKSVSYSDFRSKVSSHTWTLHSSLPPVLYN